MEWQKKHALFYKHKTVHGWLMFALTCVCAVSFVFSWLFWMVGHQRIAGILLGTGVPEKEVFVSYRDVMPPGELSDVAVNDEGIFLLFETSAVVRAYDHSGRYRYSLIFSNLDTLTGRSEGSTTESGSGRLSILEDCINKTTIISRNFGSSRN